jgi:hypothetical protein
MEVHDSQTLLQAMWKIANSKPVMIWEMCMRLWKEMLSDQGHGHSVWTRAASQIVWTWKI